jgi:hypothetical protein
MPAVLDLFWRSWLLSRGDGPVRRIIRWILYPVSIHLDPPTLRAFHCQKAFDIRCLFPSAIPWLSFEGTVVFPI